MAETSIVTARAAVYYYDQVGRQWKPMDSGLSRVDVYQNTQTGIWRIVAIDQKNPSNVTINSTLFKELIYQKASDLFHQWTDTRNSYGLNFASRQEADSFAATVTECINKLKAGITAAAAAPAATTEGTKSNESGEKKKKTKTEKERTKKTGKKKLKEGKKKGHKKEPSTASGESQGSTETPQVTETTTSTTSAAQTSTTTTTQAGPLPSPHATTTTSPTENKSPGSLAEQLAKVKLNETSKEIQAQRETRAAAPPATDLNSELATKLKQRQSAIAEKTAASVKESTASPPTAATSSTQPTAASGHTPQTSNSSPTTTEKSQPTTSQQQQQQPSSSTVTPSQPKATMASKATTTTAAPASSKVGTAQQTSPAVAITKEDLEHFKQEIISYIDKVKQEILEAIHSQREGNEDGGDE